MSGKKKNKKEAKRIEHRATFSEDCHRVRQTIKIRHADVCRPLCTLLRPLLCIVRQGCKRVSNFTHSRRSLVPSHDARGFAHAHVFSATRRFLTPRAAFLSANKASFHARGAKLPPVNPHRAVLSRSLLGGCGLQREAIAGVGRVFCVTGTTASSRS